MLSFEPQVFIPNVDITNYVSSNLSADKSLMELSNTLDKIGAKIQAINDYRTETNILVNVQQFGDQLLQIPNLTPDDAEKQWQNFQSQISQDMDKMSDEARLQLDRKLQLMKVNIMARVTAKYHQDQIAEAFTSTIQNLNNIANSVRNGQDLADKLQLGNIIIQNGVKQGIIDAKQVPKLLDVFKNQAIQNAVAGDFESGSYEQNKELYKKLGVPESELFKYDQQYKKVQIQKIKEQQLQQQLNWNTNFENLAKNIAMGQATLRDISIALANGDIDESRYNALMRLMDEKESHDPSVISTFVDIQNKIMNGVYQSKNDLLNDLKELVNDGKLPARAMLQLSELYDKRMFIENKPAMNKNLFKHLLNDLKIKISNSISQYRSIGAEVKSEKMQGIDVLSNLVSNAQTMFYALVDKYCSNKECTDGDLFKIHNQVIDATVSPFLKEKFVQYNQDYFEQSFSDLGVPIKSELSDKIISEIWKNFGRTGHILLSGMPDGWYLPLYIPFKSDDIAKKYKASGINLVITPKGIKPKTDFDAKLLQKIFNQPIKPNTSVSEGVQLLP